MENGQAAHVTFYRVVRTNPPSLEDFISPDAMGRELKDSTPERHRLWRGLSVYDTEERARKKAKKVPLLGRYIAKLEIPADGTIHFERTTTSTGHYTLWGTSEDLLRSWASVAPVEEREIQDGI